MPRKPRQKKRRGPEDRQAFLTALAAGQSVTAAAEAAGIDRKTAYRWRDAQPDFAASWEDALEDGTDHLEDEALRRAFAGSDLLLIFLLKARRPKKYRERVAKTNINTGPNDGALQGQRGGFEWLDELPREDRDTLHDILRRYAAAKKKANLSGEGGPVLISSPPAR